MPEKPFYITGGTLPPDATSYVPRLADRDLYEGLLTGDYCYVLNTRQMGKSSLMIRTAQRLREAGCAVAALDLTAIGQNLTVEQWYDGLLISLGEQIGLETEMEDFWEENAHLGPMQRFLAAIRQVALQKLSFVGDTRSVSPTKSLVIFVDEIDAVRSLPFSVNEFFGGIRECYNRRAQDAAFERLTFCLLGVATPADLIDDTRISPFNIGRRIVLSDFTPAEAAPLAQGMGPKGAMLLSRVLYWTNGHPYMTQRLCRSVAESALSGAVSSPDVDRLCDNLFLSRAARDTDDNLAFVRTRLLRSDADLAGLLDLYQKVRNGKRVPDDETNPLCSVLRLSGVVRVDERGLLQVRNRIYDRVFDKAWVTAHMPDAELRRQRAAYRRGLFRAASVGTGFAVALGGLAIYAFIQQSVAQTATSRAENSLRIASEQKIQAEKATARAESATARAEAEKEQKTRAERQKDVALREAIRQKAKADEAFRQTVASLAEVQKQKERADTSAEAARAAQKDALSAKDEAVKQRNVAEERRMEAERRREEARRSQVRLAVDSGLRLAEYGDYPEAVLYFSEARRLEMHDPGREEVYRVRLAEALLQTPRLAGLWSMDGSVAPPRRTMGFTDDSRVIVESFSKGRNGQRRPDDASPLLWSPLTERQTTVASLGMAASPSHPRLIWVSDDGQMALTESAPAQGDIPRFRFWSVTGRQGGEAGPLSPPLTFGSLRDSGFLSVSRDGGRVALSDRKGKTCVFETATGKILRQVNGVSWASGPELSPDGKELVYFERTGSADAGAGGNGAVQVVRVEDGEPLEKEIAVRHIITGFRFNATGDRLAVTTPFDTLVFDPTALSSSNARRRLRNLFNISTPKYTVRMAFSPDGRFLALGNGGGEAAIYDGRSGKPLTTLQGTDGSVGILQFSPDGSALVTGGQSQSVRLWNTARFDAPPSSLRHTARILNCRFSPDGRFLLTSDRGGSSRLWDLYQTPPPGCPLTAAVGAEFIGGVVYSPDGRSVAVLRDKGRASVYDAAAVEPLCRAIPILPFSFGYRSERNVSFSTDSRLFAAVSADGVTIYEARTGKTIRHLRNAESASGRSAPYRRALFASGSRRIVTADGAGVVQLWDIQTGTPAATALRAEDSVSDMAVSPDGGRIAFVTKSEVVIWNIESGLRRPMMGLKNQVPGDQVDFSPDGRSLMCYGRGTTSRDSSGQGTSRYQVVVWDAKSGPTQGAIAGRLPHADSVNAAAFSPDGSTLITCAANKAFIWDIARNELLTSPVSHGNGITAVAFTPDGRMALTVGMDAFLRVWDVKTGALVLKRTGASSERPLVGGQVCLAVAPDGRSVTVGGWSGAVNWRLPRLSGTPEDSQRMARLLSCERFDPGKGNVPLDQAFVDADWQKMRRNAVMVGAAAPDSQILRRQANLLLKQERWADAERTLTSLLRQNPADLDALYLRTGVRVIQNQYRPAIEDVNRSLEFQGDPPSLMQDKAMLLAALDNDALYRTFCRDRLTPPSESQSENSYHTLQYLLFGPNALENYDRPLQIAERAAALFPNRQDAQHLLIGLLYRSGRYAEVIERQAKIRDSRGGDWQGIQSCLYYFTALSLARLNHMGEARERLAQARQRREGILPIAWRWRLEADLLEKEARERIDK